MRFYSSLKVLVASAALSFAYAVSPALSEETTATLPQAARIVSIGGSVTEIVYALGQEKRLVARDSTSVYPRAAFELPDVGYMRQLSPEGVMSVNPGAIIALEGSGPREAIDVLKKASVPFVMVPEKFNRDGIVQKIRIVGHALGEEAKAAELAKSVETDIDAAEALTAKVGERKRVLFILSTQGGKVLAAGSATAADGIIAMAGAQNVVSDFSGYKQLSDEAIVTAQPDFILMMDRGGGDHAAVERDVFANPAIASTPAGQAKRLIRMDGAYLLGFGPRTAGAIRDLSVALYGDTVQN
ncbi:iron complex transport system substrate-binding protein [Mesorhizobium albiziae]|uniref:Iron complex transport system substrate-binding protein n=1 Tax=Neomesorhizobium albiziae TaxID=335020 RepID=A0A1I3V5E8_9HYPH|nr:hemin ABC transporter substrate-binding protein [Mesorhizobium albiziae]GLS28621.1 hemin ABC transporter substrate-binding protein [Mesorhizobium albiziae]SFJ89417.1 iron complex transport system substrate-binding protein [Mesorhizobium albiziae]